MEAKIGLQLWKELNVLSGTLAVSNKFGSQRQSKDRLVIVDDLLVNLTDVKLSR